MHPPSETRSVVVAALVRGRAGRNVSVRYTAEIDVNTDYVVAVIRFLDVAVIIGAPLEDVGAAIVEVSDVNPLAIKTLIVHILAADRQTLVSARVPLTRANHVHQAEAILVTLCNNLAGARVSKREVRHATKVPVVVALVEVERILVGNGSAATSGASWRPPQRAIVVTVVRHRGIEAQHFSASRATQAVLSHQTWVVVCVYVVNSPTVLEPPFVVDEVTARGQNNERSESEKKQT